MDFLDSATGSLPCSGFLRWIPVDNGRQIAAFGLGMDSGLSFCGFCSLYLGKGLKSISILKRIGTRRKPFSSGSGGDIPLTKRSSRQVNKGVLC